MILSATHGVEGYWGSGVHVDWLLSDARASLAEDQAGLLDHALNAYGFACDRWVTEGCDLNRNCLDFNAPVPVNAAYSEVAPHLVPKALDAKALAYAEAALEAYRGAHGRRVLPPRGLARDGSFPRTADWAGVAG